MTETLETLDFQLHAEDGDPDRLIRGRVTRPGKEPSAQPAVIVVHGFKGFLRWGFFPELQRRIAARGLLSVAINLSGSGVGEDLESFTEDHAFFTSTPSRDVEDVERVRAAIEAGDVPALGGIDAERLALFGHSRGGGTALLAAERRGDYRAVATWAAVAATVRFPEETLRAWRAEGVVEIPNARTGQIHRLSTGWLDDAESNAAALDILAACGRSQTPTLLVHGADDESVPFAEGEALLEAFAPELAELIRIEGAGHTFGAVHPFAGTTPELENALDETTAFLAGRLGAAG
jgi:pimeloyl-ACP methyl ester carboxylesterase